MNLCDSARVIIQQFFLLKKQVPVVIHKYIIKYQQNHNQTILA